MFAGIVPARHPVDPEKSNRVLGFLALITGLCQFYGVPVAPNKVIRPPINRTFIKKYCTPQAGAGQDTTTACGWPTAGNRRTAATSRAHKLIYKGWRVAYDPWPTSRRPSPKGKVSKSTRSVTDKSSHVQLKTLKKRY